MGNTCAKGENKENRKDIKKQQKTIDKKAPQSIMDQAPGTVQALKDPPQKPKAIYDRNKRLTCITELSGESMSQV